MLQVKDTPLPVWGFCGCFRVSVVVLRFLTAVRGWRQRLHAGMSLCNTPWGGYVPASHFEHTQTFPGTELVLMSNCT